MKLNNRGWGTTEMFLLSGGLLLALLISVFFIAQLYGSLEKSVANKQYINLENILENAAKEYITDNEIEVSGNKPIKITYETLKQEGYVKRFMDDKNHYCDGYVNVSNVDGTNLYAGFISCPEYETLNY